MLLVMLPVGMVVGFLVAAVVTFYTPKIYESSVMIQIQKPKKQITEESENTDDLRPTLPHFMTSSEFELITSRVILVNVIKRLELIKKWKVDEESALKILKNSVTRENIRGTDLFCIKVKRPDPKEAHDIALEVAVAYKTYRRQLEDDSIQRFLSELTKAVRTQEDQVEESREALNTVARLHALSEPENAQDYVDAKRHFDYDDARRHFESCMAVLNVMKLKLATMKVEQKLMSDAVVIHKEAVLPDKPISPNVPRNLLAGILGGVMFSPLFALPLMFWVNRRRMNSCEN